MSELVWEVDDGAQGRLSWANFSSAYYRCRANASGFEPRGLLYLVDFLLMDKVRVRVRDRVRVRV